MSLLYFSPELCFYLITLQEFIFFARIYIFLYIYNTIQKKNSERSAFFFFHNMCGKCFELYFKLRVIGTKPSLVQTELLTRGKHRSGGGAWREGLKKTFPTVYGKGRDQAKRSSNSAPQSAIHSNADSHVQMALGAESGARPQRAGRATAGGHRRPEGEAGGAAS